MVNFENLCKKIIDTNGIPSEEDVTGCGYDIDHFVRMNTSGITTERLVRNARRALLDRGIHYKE